MEQFMLPPYHAQRSFVRCAALTAVSTDEKAGRAEGVRICRLTRLAEIQFV